MPDRTTVFATWVMSAALFASATTAAQEFEELMTAVNDKLAEEDAAYALAIIEYLTAGDEIGRTVFFREVGNKHLEAHFVPRDPRRAFWSGAPGEVDDIRWASDLAEGNAGSLGLGPTQNAISNAMATWQVRPCSTIPLSGLTVPVIDLGVAEFIEGLGGLPFPVADLMHAGFGSFPLGPSVIGATFTFVFLDGASEPSDIDDDGRMDTAFREIYYANTFPWAIDADNGTDVDLETVALHETGHGLSQAHFGKLFRTEANGKLHFAPRALMNPAYTGMLQKVARSDDAGHCSIWASWPNR